MSIGRRILLGCIALTMLTVIVGALARHAEHRLGNLALDLYDDAFMSMNYLRSAQVEFGNATTLAGAAASGAREDIAGDLEVARGRAMSPRGRAQIVSLERLVRAEGADPSRLASQDRAIRDAFDRAVETFADDGFRYRRDVALIVRRELRRALVATLASFAAAVLISVVLNRTIAPPIRRAVGIARAIAAGRLDNEIAPGGRGETAVLLGSLATMQAAIADAMRQIHALMDQQAARHADQIGAQNARMDAALQNMNQGLCLVSADGRVEIVNRRFAEMFGACAVGEPVGLVFGERGLALPSAGAGAGAEAGAERGGLHEAASLTLADGRTIAVSRQVMAGGGWVSTFDDVSERKEAERRLAHVARHDELTGLPNRLFLHEHVGELLASDLAGSSGGRAGQEGAASGLALLCLNVDRFRLVNELHGFAAGDVLLRAVAERLARAMQPGDRAVRLGRDEFAVVQVGHDQPRDATGLGRRLIELFEAPFSVDGRALAVGMSIGIALPTVQIADAPGLLASAERALQLAKLEDRGGVRFFEAEMDRRMRDRNQIEYDLRRALERGEFDVFYQPLVDAAGGVSGFEALLRWTSSERGPVSPAVFIPLAEEIGLIGEIGLWVLERACSDCAGWDGSLKVAVNLSPAQIGSGLLGEVSSILLRTGLSARRLELEITESALMSNAAETLDVLRSLRALGLRLAMDDFGTGYSSLGYLQRFSFDKIKIDQSFTRGLGEQADCLAIVRAVIGLGRSLGMAVNAEGVETEEQRRLLVAEGCGELQGYLFSRPQPRDRVPELLSRLGVSPRARTGSEAVARRELALS